MSYSVLSVQVPVELHKAVKKKAASDETTIREIIEKLLRDYLDR